MILVASTPGQGSEFRVRLPQIVLAHDDDLPRADGVLTLQQLPKTTILLVEDNAYVCEVIAYALGQCGYRVFPATQPEQALALARAAPDIRVLVANERLGAERGSALAERVREIALQIRVLIMSAGQEVETAFPLVERPFHILDLVQRVEAALIDVAA